MNSSQRPRDPAAVAPRRLVGRIQHASPRDQASSQMVDPALQALQQQVADLQLQLSRVAASAADQARQLDEAERRVETARKSGLAEGFSDGLQRAGADFTSRSEALAQCMAAALRSHESAIQRLGELSSSMTMAALDHVLGATHGRSETVASVVARQLELLASTAPTEVRVSADDFEDTAGLHDAMVRAGVDPARVRTDPALASGKVTIRLQLGEVDAGIDQQLAALRRLLSERTNDV